MKKIQAQAPISLKNCSRENILDYFDNAWQLEDMLLKSIIKEEAFYCNPDDLRNPLIFYLGHAAAFYLNKLPLVNLLKKSPNPDYELLFGVGVDPATPEELNSAIAQIQWPGVDKVWEYRQQVSEIVVEIIKNIPLNLPIHPQHSLWALMMGIEHQRVHFETSSMLLRQLPLDCLQRPPGWHYAPTFGQAYPNQMVEVSGGIVEIGKPQDSPIYGWDNEYGYRQVQVNNFLVSKYMITNGEFKEFVDDGGYENPSYWDEEAWQWKNHYRVKSPKFWLVDERGNYQYRAMFDVFDLPLDWPVEVNYYEAITYCRFQGQGIRLMTEAEWNLVTYGSQKNRCYTLENDNFDDYNLNLKFCSPTPVGMLKNTGNNSEIYDLRGNVWEWLEDDFNPLTDFQPHYLYADNSTPFFNSQHKMMLGGAWVTNGTEILPYYRNWFRRNFYQHAGFRIAQSL